MVDKHDLENMIFNLENRKDLKEVRFTQKAVIEILGYLKELDCLQYMFERTKQDIKFLEEKLQLTEKALELAVETMRYELGREAIKNLYKDAIKNLKDNLNMKFDTEMCEWFIEQAKEMMKSE